MPIYQYLCESCDCYTEVFSKIKDGPPAKVDCNNCGGKTHQIFSAGFILKGDNWPGKSLKERDYKSGVAKEEMEDIIANENRTQRIADEVAQVRRQGKKATRKLKEENPAKYKEYIQGLKKGVRGKNVRKKV